MTTHIHSVQLARYVMETVDLKDRRQVVLHLKNCKECMAQAQWLFHNIATEHNTAQFRGYFDFSDRNRIKSMLKAYVKSGAIGTLASNFVQSASENENVKRNILKVNDVPTYELTYNPPFNANDPVLLTIEILDKTITEGKLYIDDLAEYRECIDIYDSKMVLLVEQQLEFYDITIQHFKAR